MRKILNIFIIFLFVFEVTSFATMQKPNNIFYLPKITLNKEIVHPNEEIVLNIIFGQKLSEFEIDVAYDKNLLEYISVDSNVNVNNNGDILTMSLTPMSNEKLTLEQIKVIFKAKEDIIATNPTDLKITFENLKDEDLTNIKSPNKPIEKNVIVEPIYSEYKFDFSYENVIKPNVEKEMKLVLKSKMGQNYTNTKIYASVLKPDGSNVKLVANDENGVEYNFFEEGWGSINGEPIGGKNITKELDVRGIFSEEGIYEITFKVVDINSSDYVIASDTFEIEVGDKLENIGNLVINNNVGEASSEISSIKDISEANIMNSNIVNTKETKPAELPKAGIMIYYIIIPIAFFITIIYVCLKNRDEEI